jgi:transposase
MIELAWLWVRWQPDSPISRKWKPRLEKRGRSRKTAIVAVARELAVAILHLAKDGVEIRGAIKNGRLPVPTAILGSPLAA